MITSDSPSKKNEVPHLQVHWRELLERVSDESSMAFFNERWIVVTIDKLGRLMMALL